MTRFRTVMVAIIVSGLVSFAGGCGDDDDEPGRITEECTDPCIAKLTACATSFSTAQGLCSIACLGGSESQTVQCIQAVPCWNLLSCNSTSTSVEVDAFVEPSQCVGEGGDCESSEICAGVECRCHFSDEMHDVPGACDEETSTCTTTGELCNERCGEGNVAFVGSPRCAADE